MELEKKPHEICVQNELQNLSKYRALITEEFATKFIRLNQIKAGGMEMRHAESRKCFMVKMFTLIERVSR